MTNNPIVPSDEVIDFNSFPPDLEELLSNSEAEETIGVFLEEWSKGNYEAAYDLLTSDSPILDGLSRDEWINRRRQWNAMAHPQEVKIMFLEEHESDTGEEPYIVEVGWSLAFTDTPSASQLKELPMATCFYQETGRHWFWTSYAVVERDDELQIQNITDEGAKASLLSADELNQRIQEIAELVTAQLEELEQEEASEEEEEGIEERAEEEEEEETSDGLEFLDMVERAKQAIKVTTIAMHFNDTLIAQSPLSDASIYDMAFEEAETVQDHERAAAYMQLLSQHFPGQRGDTLRRLAIALFNIGETYNESGQQEKTVHFLTLAENALRDSIAIDNTPFSNILLAQTLLAQNKQITEAETLLQQAQSSTVEPKEMTLIEAGLARIAMLRDETEQALAHYQRAAEISPDFPNVWLNIGQLQSKLQQYEAAEQSFLRSIHETPDLIDAYAELGALYSEQLHDLPKAHDILEQGLEVEPDSAELHAMLAMIHIQEDDLRGAKAHLDQAEEIDPDQEIVQKVRQVYDARRAQRQSPKNKSKSHKAKKR